MKKKILALSMAVIVGSLPIINASAATKDELKQQKAAANAQLSEANKLMNDLENKNQELVAQIGEKDAALVQTLASIDSLNAQIEAQEVEIQETKEDLAEAEANRDQQYEDMKKRIQYLYQNGGSNAWAQMLLEEQDLSKMLNQAEYTQKLYEYDRECLAKLAETVEEVSQLENQLEEEKASMESTKAESEAEKANLESQLADMKATSADYENQLENIQAKAAQYSREIQAVDAELEKIRVAEEKAAEEARKEAERKAAEQANKNNNTSSSSSSSSSGSSSSSSNKPSNGSSSGSANKPSGGSSSGSNSGSTSGSGSSSSGSTASGSGQAVVNYATQFVGNPYVWGGTSLTNGADCSGFIMSVYAHFGVSLPHSSAAMRSVGRGVSYSEAQPGDIICYSGHVAIYMGGGAIVHASNAKDGIKISSNAAYRPILAVRRIF